MEPQIKDEYEAHTQQLALEICSFYEKPAGELIGKPCCTYCGCFRGGHFVCGICRAQWCSHECAELQDLKSHDKSTCAMRKELFKGEYSTNDKRAYISKYGALLPPVPPVALLTLPANTTNMQMVNTFKSQVIINPADSKYAPIVSDTSLNPAEFQSVIREHLLQNHFPLGSTVEFLEATIFPDLQHNLNIGAFHHEKTQHGHHYYYYQPYHRHTSYFFPRLGWLSYNDTFWALAILNGLVPSRNE